MSAAFLSLALLAAPLPTFFDMKHSNNAARIRIWMALKDGMTSEIGRHVVTYPELKTPEFAAVNPLMKVPGFVREDGTTVFESAIILNYLEDKYDSAADGSPRKPFFKPDTPEGRQEMDLLIRVHDLYIASPNCNAPGFSHSQGSMYLSYAWHGQARGMDLKTREAKVAEIWKQLNWLEKQAEQQQQKSDGPYLMGEQLTLADMTWFPTGAFMEHMLPRVFGWAEPFVVGGGTPFPTLARWYTALREIPAFASARAEILEYWQELDAKGQFEPIVQEIAEDAASAAAAGGEPRKFRYGVPSSVKLRTRSHRRRGSASGGTLGRRTKETWWTSTWSTRCSCTTRASSSLVRHSRRSGSSCAAGRRPSPTLKTMRR
jgi:glutathione S-transferase